jgi:arylsulfatase A-like enzyme
MTRFKCVTVFSIFLALFLFFSPAAQGAAPEYVVIVVIDACRADYLDVTNLPNIRSLMAEGVFYRNAWTGQLINNTPPAHATIGTGVFPAKHGVVAFAWRDPSTGTIPYNLGILSDVIDDQIGQLIAASNVPRLVRQFRTKYPGAKAVSLSADKYYAASAMGNSSADYILFGLYVDGAYRPVAIKGHEPPDSIMKSPLLQREALLSYPQKDKWAMDAALEFVKNIQPRILMVNLPATDVAGHLVGGIVAPTIMATIMTDADNQIGRLRSAYSDAGILDKTLFVVVADHGMIPNAHVIDPTPVRDAAKASGVSLAPNTGNVHLWLSNSSKARNVANLIVQNAGNDYLAVFYKVETSGKYSYVAAKKPSIRSAYTYLLNTFKGPNGPDIVLVPPENTVIGAVNEPLNSKGDHSSITWGCQHIPLILSGPGVKQGRISTFPARLVDIAPTVLALAGVQPRGMDGVVLADAMSTSTAAQRQAQQDILVMLKTAQDRLIAMSSKGSGEFRAAGVPAQSLPQFQWTP